MENIKSIYRIKTKQSYKREMIGVQIWGKEINSERERERVYNASNLEDLRKRNGSWVYDANNMEEVSSCDNASVLFEWIEFISS